MKNLSRSSQHGTMPEVQNDTEGTAGSPQRARLERPWQEQDTHPPAAHRGAPAASHPGNI